MTNVSVAYAAHPVETPTFPSFKRVLFTTDFSKTSLAALPLAAAVARSFGGELRLVHVLIPDEYIFTLPEPAADIPGLMARDAKARLTALKYSYELQGLESSAVEVFRHGIDGFVKKLAADKCDLVVMATHGSKGFRHLLLGSVAEDIIHSALCPVLTVGPGMRMRYDAEFRPKHILFATDASPDSFRALPYAVQFAKNQCTDLTLMHVLPKAHRATPEADAFAALLRDALHRALPLSAIKSCNPEIIVCFGDAAGEILRVAREHESELIIMGARSNVTRGKFSRSVSYHVLAKAACPVLTVRGRER